MKLLLETIGTVITTVLDWLPDAPAPIAGIALPLPPWIPAGPVLGSLVIVLAGGLAFLGLRLIRWIYGLVPVVQ